MSNIDKLINYYKEQARPMFDRIFDIQDARHEDLREDLDYVVFYGEIATGARIVVSNRNEGQVKVRIWDPKLDNLLDGVESFFDELHHLERHAEQVIGLGELFVSKEVNITVLEKAEIDEVLKGSTVRLPPFQKFWKTRLGFTYSYSSQA